MGQHARSVTWLISGYDFEEHGFYDPEPDANYRVALCTHSAPIDRLVTPNKTDLAPRRCTACLLVFGHDVAEQHGDSGPWR